MNSILGGTFGKRTILQDIILTILKTASFPNLRTNCDTFYDDGYIISDKNKLLIDDCLKNFPELLFLHDLPKEDPDYEPETYSALAYAYKITQVGNGWAARCTYQSVTSIMAYLIEQGAGIGNTEMLYPLDLTKMRPQLFVGASVNFKQYREGVNRHIFNCEDVIKLHQKQLLSNADITRLRKQAMNGLKYGNFNSTTKLELIKIHQVLEVANLLNHKQLVAYLEYKVELEITFLQAVHQLKKVNCPPEIVYLILTYLIDLNEHEIKDMSNKIIEKHEQEFPIFKMRRA